MEHLIFIREAITDSEIARFYTRSYIWNKDDEFLTALKGSYDRKADLYTFTDQSYILTKTREVWADTILYTLCW